MKKRLLSGLLVLVMLLTMLPMTAYAAETDPELPEEHACVDEDPVDCKCDVCGEPCHHVGEDGVCSACYAHTHADESGDGFCDVLLGEAPCGTCMHSIGKDACEEPDCSHENCAFCIVTEDEPEELPEKPAVPGKAALEAALKNMVWVCCEARNHPSLYMDYLEGAVSVTDPVWDAQEEAYCSVVFIDAEAYAAKYDELVDGEGHVYTKKIADGLKIKYDDITGTWVCLNMELVLKMDCAIEPVVYHAIEVISGKHGDVYPDDVVFVAEGDDKTFYFDPDKGYEVSAVYVDGHLVSYHGVCIDHHWTCKGCDECWWIDWSHWYACDDYWCDHDDCWYGHYCDDYWCDHDDCWYDYYGYDWYDWQKGITFYDVDADHTLRVEFAPIVKDCASAYYWDLDTDAWYHEATDFVINKGLMKGIGSKTFDPYGSTTRGELVTMLYRLAGEPKPLGTSAFTDVAEDQWYTDAVIWAANKGIVTGYGDGTFGVEDVVTREQTVAILFRYAKWAGCNVSDLASLLNFVDADEVSEYAEKPFGWAVEEDVIEGKPVSGMKLKLDPQGITERVEMAAMLMRFAKLVD